MPFLCSAVVGSSDGSGLAIASASATPASATATGACLPVASRHPKIPIASTMQRRDEIIEPSLFAERVPFATRSWRFPSWGVGTRASCHGHEANHHVLEGTTVAVPCVYAYRGDLHLVRTLDRRGCVHVGRIIPVGFEHRDRLQRERDAHGHVRSR